MSARIVDTVSETLTARTVRSRGVPKVTHERVVVYRLDCGHEVTRRYKMNAGTTKARYKLRCCEVCAAESEETAA